MQEIIFFTVPSTGQILPDEPASNPPVPTQAHTDNAVQFRISNFQSNQVP